MNCRHWVHICVLLGAAAASPTVKADEGLSVGALRVLIFHVGVESGVTQVGFVAIVALVVSALEVVFGAALLLGLVRPVLHHVALLRISVLVLRRRLEVVFVLLLVERLLLIVRLALLRLLLLILFGRSSLAHFTNYKQVRLFC